MSQTKPLHYGIDKCYYALKTAQGYGTPKRLRGATSLTVNPEGDTQIFYADNTAYHVTTTNNGRSGSLTLAGMSDEALCDLLGYMIDDNGLVLELADADPSEFALLFQVETDDAEKPTLFAMYDVKLTRSTREHSTKEESVSPNTESFNYTATPAEFTLGGRERRVVGAHCDYSETTKETYESWFTEVVEPSKAAA